MSPLSVNCLSMVHVVGSVNEWNTNDVELEVLKSNIIKKPFDVVT